MRAARRLPRRSAVRRDSPQQTAGAGALQHRLGLPGGERHGAKTHVLVQLQKHAPVPNITTGRPPVALHAEHEFHAAGHLLRDQHLIEPGAGAGIGEIAGETRISAAQLVLARDAEDDAADVGLVCHLSKQDLEHTG